MADRLAALRLGYARAVIAAAPPNARVEQAFATTPREEYLTAPPWHVFEPGSGGEMTTCDPAALYADVLVVLDRGRGINNGQPSLHAAWIASVDPQPGERIVQIGIGSGYYTAILARLVGEAGRIDAYEIEPRLASVAAQNLCSLKQVRVYATSGVGAELPRADVIYVSAAAAAPDLTWLRALAEGGRLVFPWQPDLAGGSALLVSRTGQGFRARPFMSVSFVGCIGAGLKDLRSRRHFIPSHRTGETRSLRLTADEPPDASATAVFDDVWFSSRELG